MVPVNPAGWGHPILNPVRHHSQDLSFHAIAGVSVVHPGDNRWRIGDLPVGEGGMIALAP